MLIKEYILRVPEEQDDLVTTTVQKLGAEVELIAISSDKKKRKPKKERSSTISPTYLFGAWKELKIDPDKLREEAWGRSLEF